MIVLVAQGCRRVCRGRGGKARLQAGLVSTSLPHFPGFTLGSGLLRQFLWSRFRPFARFSVLCSCLPGGLFLLLLLQGQLHGPDAQGPHIGQRTEHLLLAVGLWGLEGQAQALPHGAVTAFRCPEALPSQALWGEVVVTLDTLTHPEKPFQPD